MWNWHIDALAEHLEGVTRGHIRNLLITIPPRHGKSTIVSVGWPCWEWIDHPERRWLFASYAESLAIRDNVRSRRLIQSVWYQTNWGDRFQFAGDQNEKRKVETDRGGHRIAVGTGGSATGEGGDRLIIDDPNNIADVESVQIRKGTLDWFDQVWSTRANDPKTTAKVIIMQRSHCDDLAGHVLEQGGWEHLSIPAEYEGDTRKTVIGWQDPRTEVGELLWPARFGVQEITALKRTMGSYAVASQLQQRPSPAGGGIFKRWWWKYYQPRGANLPPVSVRLADGAQGLVAAVEAPQRVDEQIQSWDMAFKGLDTSDFVCGQVWARCGSRFLLGDQVHARLDLPGTVKAVRELTNKWPGTIAKLVEDKANGPAVLQMLACEIPGLLPVNPSGGKVARAQAVSPLIEAGNVFLPHPALALWVPDFIEECAAFPAAKHDDQVDAMTQALLRFHQAEADETLMFLDWRTGTYTDTPVPEYRISVI